MLCPVLPSPRLLLITSNLKCLFSLLPLPELQHPSPLHPAFKLIKLGCFIRGHTHSSKARHTCMCTHKHAHNIQSWLDKPYCSYMHTHTHTYVEAPVHPFFSSNP
ncbi:hypothetical protein XENORESO_017108 [Xenotaenia resolanae]|uniref:Uncharacterized protein n=1 Tax=Xenotaenia resolanae TaxID=208358 RepID=A0ABV0WTP1_9TELE